MAIRLPVIITQSEARDQRSSDIEESLVAELIMADGLDATLVGPLVRLQPDSTDMLCLKGFTHDLALLGWMPLDQAESWWRSNGMTGVFVPLPIPGTSVNQRQTVPGATSTGRRIAYCQLDYSSDPMRICDGLRSRLQDMRTKPVSIQLTMPKNSSSSGMPLLPVVQNPMAITPANSLPRPASDGATTSPKAILGGKTQPLVASSEDEEWSQLDQLVDDLDALDL